jgi:ribosomal protein S6--L-glutamate ligase
MAWRVFTTLEQLRAVLYCQEFLQGPGYDLRLLVIADAIFSVKRIGQGDWRTNVSRGGTAEPHEPTFEQMQIAFKAVRAVGAWMAGVDLLTDSQGRDVVLEVNAVPGWKATAKALDIDIARVVLEKLLWDTV